MTSLVTILKAPSARQFRRSTHATAALKQEGTYVVPFGRAESSGVLIIYA